jgi:hypothetical protein
VSGWLLKATFFLIGQNAAEYPDIVRRIAAEGHEIANHLEPSSIDKTQSYSPAGRDRPDILNHRRDYRKAAPCHATALQRNQ